MNKKTLFKFIIIILIIAIALWIGIYYRDQLSLTELRSTVQSFGLLAPLIFIAIYITATVFFLPGSVLTIAGGLIFGPIFGTLYNLIGATIGASFAFLIARYVASDWVKGKTGGRLKQLMEGVEKEGWRFVAVTRLVPMVPFNLLNYALGLTKIPILQYFIATAIFMLPGCFVYTYVGSLGEAFINEGGAALAAKIVIAIGLFVLLSLIPWAIKKFRNRSSRH